MYLIVPGKFKSHFGVNGNLVAVADDDFNAWRLDMVQFGKNAYIVIVHIASLFCKIVNAGDRSDSLVNIGNALGCSPFDLKYATNNNRSVIGSIKDIHFLIESWAYADGVMDVDKIAFMVNKTPFSYLGMDTPAMRWVHLTNQFTGDDH